MGSAMYPVMTKTTTPTTLTIPTPHTRTALEAALGEHLIRGWHLIGAGPARWGWASVAPVGLRWEGRTLAEIAQRIDLAAAEVVA